jgi:isoquinoline 1-oxidoreductase
MRHRPSETTIGHSGGFPQHPGRLDGLPVPGGRYGPARVRVLLNGTEHELTDSAPSLLVALRDQVGLTGAKYGCGEGSCGACSVLVDGEVVRACITAVNEVGGRRITTVEGIAQDGRLHPVQQAFVDAGALQCGYCTPGMIVAASALLAHDPDPSDNAIRAQMQANICRCGAYPRIMRAIRNAVAVHDAAAVAPRSSAVRVRPRAPWDLCEPEDRDYFAVLGEGVVVIVPPDLSIGSGGAWLHAEVDGGITVFVGKVEVGQGTTHALRLAAARELGVRAESVRVVTGDTDVCPFDIGTFGSRGMPYALPDVRIAAATARVELGNGWESRLVFASKKMPLTPAADWSDVGDPVEESTIGAVTGAKRFATDVVVPGMWHGRVLRPPAPRRRLLSVDLSAATEVPGAVVVHEDQFVGVAALDFATAQRAVDAIIAEWDDFDLVGNDALEAHLRAHPLEADGFNVASEHDAGDVDDMLNAVPVRLSHTYDAAYIAHAPMETRVALAQWDDTRLTVWTATQQPFNGRRAIAEALGVDEACVRVIVPESGGGFGGKHRPDAAIEAARLARACGHPVQVRWTREEEFTHAYFRPAAFIDVQVGATSDGDLTTWDFTNVNSGNAGIMCPYDVPHQRIRFQPTASPLRQGAYRALASTANHFARESMLDELAHHLEIDPLDLRMRHLRDDRLAAVLTTATDRFGWQDRPMEPGIGAGLALGMEKGGRVATCVEIRMEPGADDVEIRRIVTVFECGAVVDAANLRNQVEGATVMGIGGALFEAIRFDRERIINPRFSEYRVARFTDVPDIDVVLLDRPDLPSAGGGEAPIIAIAPALANAIFAATGERRRALPLLERTIG